MRSRLRILEARSSRPNSRERIETDDNVPPLIALACSSRPNSRERIETFAFDSDNLMALVPPGLTAGSGLKLMRLGGTSQTVTFLPA